MIFDWENGNAPQAGTCLLIEQICRDLAFPLDNIPAYVSGESYLVQKNYPCWPCFRDVCFWFKYFQNTDPDCFPPVPAKPYIQKHACLQWELGQQGYVVVGFRMPLQCKPLKGPFTERFPSKSTPQTLASPHAIRTEDDVLHIKNLPDFDGVLGQRDSELLLSYLTTPYIRIPLVLYVNCCLRPFLRAEVCVQEPFRNERSNPHATKREPSGRA